MTFNDFTLHAGAIRSRRTRDTDELAPWAVDHCRIMLLRLLQDGGQVEHGVDGLPCFAVSLNVPPAFIEALGEQVEAPDRIFCIQQPGRDPFQINLVLPPEPAPIDSFAAATLLGISLLGQAGRDPPPDALERIQEILSARPVLATALIPTTVDPHTIMIAADFSTCFAAAMLLEHTERRGSK